MTDTNGNFDWAGLYQSVGELVEQNRTLFHKTDDHETRIRDVESKLTKLDEKVDGLDSKVDALGGKVDALGDQLKTALTPKPSVWRKFTHWMSDRMHPMLVALLSVFGTGVGSFLLGLLMHK